MAEHFLLKVSHSRPQQIHLRMMMQVLLAYQLNAAGGYLLVYFLPLLLL